MVREVDLANAEAELSLAKAYRNRGGDLSDSNDGTNLGGLRNESLEVAEVPVSGDRNDPSLLRILYHAYDGRVVPVPSFMAAKKLADRFPNESFVPAGWRNKRVWFLEPQASMQPTLKLMCLLHVDQSEDVKETLKAAGIPAGLCSKNNIPSGFALTEHMRIKHKRERAIIEDVNNKKLQEAARLERELAQEDARAQTAAILALAKSMAPTPAGGKETK